MTVLTASDIAARRIREARKKLGWRQEDLAAKCAEAGHPEMTEAVITTLESRRRPGRQVTAEELLTLAWVLGVPPIQLLSPLNGEEILQVAPGVTWNSAEAPAWLTYEDVSAGPARLAGSDSPLDLDRALSYRESPLVLIRQIRAAARKILFHDRIRAAQEDGRTGFFLTPEQRAESVTNLGVKLLHLIASLKALGYTRPPLDDVMAVLAQYGIPQDIATWERMEAEREAAGEVPGGARP